MKNKKPLVIDFVGRAGSGKTYIKNRILEHLSDRYRCVDLSEYSVTAKDYGNFALNAPESFMSSLFLILFNIPRSYASMLKLFRKWFACQIKINRAHSMNCDIVANDEGLFIW